MNQHYEFIPITKVNVRQLPNNEQYLCEVLSVDNDTPLINSDTEKMLLKLENRGQEVVFTDESGNDYGVIEIFAILLPTEPTQWIDAKVTLPEKMDGMIYSHFVLCECDGVMFVGYYKHLIDKGWTNAYDATNETKVNFWMPLPKRKK